MEWTSQGRGALLAVLTVVSPTIVSPTASAVAQQSSGEELLAAGGLALAASNDLRIEHQDVTIAVDRIRSVYVLRNAGEQSANMQMTFALPDLDTMWIWEQPPLLPASGDPNFVRAATTVDGDTVTARLDQRATALGLDVTDALHRNAISLFPYQSGTLDTIAALPTAVRTELTERGILKAHERGLLPSWTLRTTYHWRQPIPAGKSMTLVHTYHPVVGRPRGSLAAFEKSACLDAAESKRIEALASSARPPQLTAVAFQATAGAAWSESVGRFRLTIEKPSRSTKVFTCRTDLSIVSPLQLEWSANDHAHEDDITVLFVD